MASSIVGRVDFGSGGGTTDRVVLAARPDMRVVFLGFLSAIIIALLGGFIYFSPIPDGVKVAFLPLAVIFVVVLICSAIFYEVLGNTTFTVTNEYVEEKGGFIWKTRHSIPLRYVRDVTYDQSFIQARFEVSSVTVSPTNGNKLVLSNITNGEATLDLIWKLVLTQSRVAVISLEERTCE